MGWTGGLSQLENWRKITSGSIELSQVGVSRSPRVPGHAVLCKVSFWFPEHLQS